MKRKRKRRKSNYDWIWSNYKDIMDKISDSNREYMMQGCNMKPKRPNKMQRR